MTTDDREEISDLEILQAVAITADPVATAEDICNQLPIGEKGALDRLQRLRRNGLIGVQRESEERAWTLELPGVITLDRETELDSEARSQS